MNDRLGAATSAADVSTSLLASEAGGGAVTCEFVNDTAHPLVVRWVAEDGSLRHERVVAPYAKHEESTYVGHAFSLGNRVYYRPKVVGRHLVRSDGTSRVEPFEEAPARSTYRRRRFGGYEVDVDARCENDDRLEVLRRDCEAAASRLPRRISRALRRQRIVVHLESGRFRDSCYHPAKGSAWLRANGFSASLAGCVHIYRLDDYCRDRHLWGAGGVLIHELAHATHDKLLVGGHDNVEIRERYEAAMRDRLYDCVRVKNREGGEDRARHYACTNAAEFFAELSTAFLGDEDSEAYNKWEPYNRRELERYDPQTAALLDRVWHQADPALVRLSGVSSFFFWPPLPSAPPVFSRRRRCCCCCLLYAKKPDLEEGEEEKDGDDVEAGLLAIDAEEPAAEEPAASPPRGGGRGGKRRRSRHEIRLAKK